ncbi:MAG: restriction endonuclease [Oceanobacter sp.]
MKGWMIRAGRHGRYFDNFYSGDFVAIGWDDLGDLIQYETPEQLKAAYIDVYGHSNPAKTGNAVAMLRKFRDDIQSGDIVISYSQETREYLVGHDKGQYYYATDDEEHDYGSRRKVDWLGKVSRDSLSAAIRNTLGSTLTLFALNDDCIKELQSSLEGKPTANTDSEVIETELEQVKDEVISRSHELIKDLLQALDADEMEQMMASVLRAMGFKTKVSPKGPDRGVDILASPDGLGLTTPRIKVEVKHRKGAMGSQAIRSFIGALRDGDSGLYLSTGGFSKEARYEAERSTMQLTLVDMDDLADLIVTHYESFDVEGRTLMPLVRLYWPAE